MKKIKVLLVCDRFRPSPYGGGVSRHVHDLAKYLFAHGDEVHVLGPRSYPAGTEPFFPKEITILKRLSPNFDYVSEILRFNYSLEVLQYVDKIGGNYDIIHVHSERNLFLHYRTTKTPIIATLHGISSVCVHESPLNSDCGATNWAKCSVCQNSSHFQKLMAPFIGPAYMSYYRLRRKSLLSMDLIICVSNYLKKLFSESLAIPNSKMVAIPNGVNLNSFTPSLNYDFLALRAALAQGSDKIILCVGRLVPEKGIQVLVSSMPQILQKVNARLIVVGIGPYRSELEAQASKLNLNSNITFAHDVDDVTLQNMYAVADVCVVPSLYEPFGITALEAFVARKPLVVSDLGGLSETVQNQKNGLKVAPNDSSALAEAIVTILLDPSLGDSLTAKAYSDLLNKYSWLKVGGRIRALYQALT